jgi:hypothetical protein
LLVRVEDLAAVAVYWRISVKTRITERIRVRKP